MISAIICAAGRGERAGFSQNKILRELNGMPVLCHSLSAFAASGADEILVACREEDEDAILPLLSPYPNARTVRGGETRFCSVLAALREAKGEIVLVHDAARPFVTGQLIADCAASVKKHGSGICALPATDTVVRAEQGRIVSVPERNSLYTVQTPQGFYREKLLAAYERAIAEHTEHAFTDDGGVYARYAGKPVLFTGDRANKKLTYPEDFAPAERVGFGVDTHAFTPPAPSCHSERSEESSFFCRSERSEESHSTKSDFITLGGVRIPSERTLIAHSDGDVLVHALMDALLSAAGLRDIGYYFPDTDEKYAGANSMELLDEVLRQTEYYGFVPKNVSIAVLAEKPRLSPYIERMKQNLADALKLPLSAIGIAAGTNEKLGYIGEGKGITVYATVLLKKNTIE